jgi:Flp pilus assembly protein TadG
VQPRTNSERGSVLVMVTLWLPLVVAIAAFVIDVGNWYEHKRHLQLQADAAAFAGGDAISLSACNNTAIENETRAYAGPDATTPAAPYNAQIGGTASNKLHVLINSTDFWNDGGTDFSDGTHPCDSNGLHVDVKITEDSNSALRFFTPILSLFGSGALSPTINAHARVEINQATTFAGNLPIGVVDISPRSGAAIFYDEDAGTSSTPIDVRYLTATGSSAGFAVWSDTVVDPSSPSTTGPASVPIGSRAHIGAVVALSSDGPPINAPMSISGTVAQICSRPRVDCYYSDTSTGSAVVSSGLLLVQGYDGSSTTTVTTPPILHAAQLSAPATCGDGTYAYFFYRDTTCTVQLTAEIATSRADNEVQLKAFGGNCGNNGCPLSFVSASGNVQTWRTAATGGTAIGVPAHSGPDPITLKWIVKNGTLAAPYGSCGTNFNENQNPCHDSWGVVQRSFSGSDNLSGPIRFAHLINMDGAPIYGPQYNSYPRNSTHSLAVAVGIAGQLAQSASDPPVALRAAGSQNGSIDCQPSAAGFTGKNLREEIATGCEPEYRINADPDRSCPSTSAQLWVPQPPPWQCVATQTGNSVGPFTQGIQDRILGGVTTCPSGFQPPYSSPLNAPYVPGGNYWQWYGSKDFVATDPRIVQVFMVPAGSFQGSGNAIYPVVNVGVFYITGWGGNGSGNNDPCQQLDGTPADFAPTGFLVGHFIKRSTTINNGGATVICDLSSFAPCVPVLTE